MGAWLFRLLPHDIYGFLYKVSDERGEKLIFSDKCKQKNIQFLSHKYFNKNKRKFWTNTKTKTQLLLSPNGWNIIFSAVFILLTSYWVIHFSGSSFISMCGNVTLSNVNIVCMNVVEIRALLRRVLFVKHNKIQ